MAEPAGYDARAGRARRIRAPGAAFRVGLREIPVGLSAVVRRCAILLKARLRRVARDIRQQGSRLAGVFRFARQREANPAILTLKSAMEAGFNVKMTGKQMSLGDIELCSPSPARIVSRRTARILA